MSVTILRAQWLSEAYWEAGTDGTSEHESFTLMFGKYLGDHQSNDIDPHAHLRVGVKAADLRGL